MDTRRTGARARMWCGILLVIGGAAACASQDPSSGVVRVRNPSLPRACPADWISTTVATDVAAPIDRTFSAGMDEQALARLLKRYWPIPKVVRTEMREGTWGQVGAKRRVFFEHGGSLLEEVIEVESPRLFAYRIHDFDEMFVRSLASEGRGVFAYDAIDDRTRITWTYCFKPLSTLRGLPLRVVVGVFQTGFMKQTLADRKRLTETGDVG